MVSLISSTCNLSKCYVFRNFKFVLFTYRTSKLDNELASSFSIGVPLMSKSNSLPRLDESNEISCEFYACIYVNDFNYEVSILFINVSAITNFNNDFRLLVFNMETFVLLICNYYSFVMTLTSITVILVYVISKINKSLRFLVSKTLTLVLPTSKISNLHKSRVLILLISVP